MTEEEREECKEISKETIARLKKHFKRIDEVELQGKHVVVYAKKDQIGFFPTWEEAWIYLNIERNKGTFEGPFKIFEALTEVMPNEKDLVTIKTHIRRYPI